MPEFVEHKLDEFKAKGNFRKIPHEKTGLIDFSSNDYLGIGTDRGLRERFLSGFDVEEMLFSSSASRLLAKRQKAYESLERTLSEAYGGGRKALIFNSGYHANVGCISALGKETIILADKLVHASIIDGIKLGGGTYARFQHNDVRALERLLEKYYGQGKDIMIVVESIYSMDGDKAPLEAINELKKRYPGTLLYVDEAHAVGAVGPSGIGFCTGIGADIIIGTFGKALGGVGAYAVCSEILRDYLINCARSFIFSTALPPVSIAWDEFTFCQALEMDSRREYLKALGSKLRDVLKSEHSSHIQPLLIGNPTEALSLSGKLELAGISALAIRTPTVPAGTERIRFSLSADLSEADIDALAIALKRLRNG